MREARRLRDAYRALRTRQSSEDQLHAIQDSHSQSRVMVCFILNLDRAPKHLAMQCWRFDSSLTGAGPDRGLAAGEPGG
jgi:hypothetical protein